MARLFTEEDVEAALLGGLFLSAGGSGRGRAPKQRILGRMAIDYGCVAFAPLDEFADGDVIVTATGVGAPGGGRPLVGPRDSVESARILAAALPEAPKGVMCGHVPGFNGWLVASALDIPYVDAAANGRGHPTVMMGGLGLASRPDIAITQVGVGGLRADGSRLTVTATGNISLTEKVLRQAATLNGGLIMATRGPVTAGFVKENAAAGAITFQLDLGRAMLAAEGPARVTAAVDFLGGEILVAGEVTRNTVAYGDGFDLGEMTVKGPEGEIALGVFNEFMTAEKDGERIATFPDQIGTLDPEDGHPVAISELPVGARCVVILARRDRFPVGKGAVDPAVFPEVEAAMGVDLQSYL